MNRPIAPGLSPNLEGQDARAALSFMVSPWGYNRGEWNKKLLQWFETYFPNTKAFSFSSGRNALYGVLKALGVGKNDEVLVPAFTCVAVMNAIVATGARVVFIDIKEDFTYDAKDIEKKLNPSVKVILVQHTFGIPAFTEDVLALIKKHQLLVVEDVAHTIGAMYKGHKLGTIGDASIFSFGRDKAFSSVTGGIALFPKKTRLEKFEKEYQTLSYPPLWWSVQQLLHPVSMYFFVLPFYDVFKIGKLILVLLQKLHLLSFPIDPQERENFVKHVFLLPDVLAGLAFIQLERLNLFNNKREAAVAAYNRISKQKFAGPLLRYPLLVKDQKRCKAFFRQQGIYLGDWYSHLIDPKSTNVASYGYKKGSCPTAEKIASHIVNFPTYPTLSKDAILKVIAAYRHYDH